MDTEIPKTAVQYIHSLGRFSGAPGLHRIRALCAALGNPQDELKFVHLAGTNGKGSTACMTAAALQAAGFRTGLYTSPYLTQFHERIRVNGRMIADGDLTRLSARVAAAARGLSLPEGESIGEFEFTTALAFLYFREQACDIVVLETGLGGRFDATNVIKAPEACVITSVSFDHMAVLGDTLSAIAAEKAAIIKKGAAVVCAPGQPDEVTSEIRAACAQVGAAYPAASDAPPDFRLLRCDIGGSAFVYDGQGYTVAMPGLHQLDNAVTALQTLEALRGRGWKIPVLAAVQGLASARMPGRLERVRESPLVLLDGAHNQDGVRALCRVIEDMLKMRRLIVVMGMLRDKAFEGCIAGLARRADVFCACAPEGEARALPAPAIAALAEQQCGEVYDCGSAEQAISLALSLAGPKDCVLVCGSLYLVGEAEKILRARQKPAE